MQESHIHLKDNKQEIKITILERKEGQSYGMDDNDFLPVKIEYKSRSKNFTKERVYLDTYELVSFYCFLESILMGKIVEKSFSFAEPYVWFVLENVKDKIFFTLYYKENEEDETEIKILQRFNKTQFKEFIEKVHQGCNLWIDDSDLIDFREYLDDIEDSYYDKILLRYRVAEVEFKNSGKLYCYLCGDKNIKKGDLVVVPTFFGKETIVKVIDIENFDEDDLPCPLEKMKEVIKKYVIPLSEKIGLHSYDITESGFGFELLVNFVIKKDEKIEFSIKDKNAYYNVILNEYKDIYLDVYKEMLSLKSNEMQITKGLWVTAQNVLHVGFMDVKKKKLKTFYLNILDKAKELKKNWIGIPCVLERYCGISPKTMFKIALKTVKEWIAQNEDYQMEVLFCCPNEKLYKRFKKIYDKKIGQNGSN